MYNFLNDLARFNFLQYALVTGVLASVACGIIGTYVVVRRISFIADGIAHSVLAGMGSALFFRTVHGWEWVSPLYGAVAAALVTAIIIGVVSLWTKEREDTIIGALWAVGMAVGILFIARTPGYSTDLMSYLFGNILLVTEHDLWLMAGLDLLVVVAGVLFYNRFLAVCFDDEFARVAGLRVEVFYLALLCLTALTVVVLVTVVGIVMVIALLTLPVAIAGFFSRSLWQMMALSAMLSMVFTTAGLVVSYEPNYPTGATTIMICAVAYLVVVIGEGLRKRGRG
ncbi:MAG: metal ABC transporter permease [Desulfomonile sp.]|nr:metal ABC transporter permease [Desulfomonile sp.]